MDNGDKKLFSASVQMTPMIYKDFYKAYYAEKLSVFNSAAIIIAALLLLGAVYILKNGFGILWAVILAWIGVFIVFYPRMLYRKPYKRSKNSSQTTHFAFYENYMTERINSKTEKYMYSSLDHVTETGKYFLIYHSAQSVSIVDKSRMSCASEEMASFLKVKTKYKRIK